MDISKTEPLTLPLGRMAAHSGFGMTTWADAFVYRPATVTDAAEVFEKARRTGRRVVLRGAGRSYGDASILSESISMDLGRMNSVLDWDSSSGVMELQAGATIGDLWRHALEDGWWPPVVSGTMYPTLAGALSMNIHGKNAWKVGTLGEHVLELDVLQSNGILRTLRPGDQDFYSVVSGIGLLGAITRVRMQMHRVRSGRLSVLAVSAENWRHQFDAFTQHAESADYMVSWVDCFARGRAAGRGLFHCAIYGNQDDPANLRPNSQDLPDSILGFWPKSNVWQVLKLLNGRTAMRLLNAAKHFAGRKASSAGTHMQSLVEFSFLLDYVPNWRRAYLPGGFIQYQSFIPTHAAPEIFAEQIRMQQCAKLESFLGVLKKHREDRFLLSHGVDGFSLALDFKVTDRNWPAVVRLCHQMNDLVLSAGGRFYLAKDSTLRPEDCRRYLGCDTLERLRTLKRSMDPDHVLDSSLARRLGLLESSR